jgi:hypothetical protein
MKSSAIGVTTSASLERPNDDDIIAGEKIIDRWAMLRISRTWQRDGIASTSLRLVASRAVPQRKG